VACDLPRPWVLITAAPVMFKITQNTLRGFTLAEVLLMVAMNQLEAESKAFETAAVYKLLLSFSINPSGSQPQAWHIHHLLIS
jgi:hypothetical protein